MARPRRERQPKIKEKPEFEQKLVDLARVTRVTRGGKRLSFRALVVIGDKKGKVSYGVAKGKDVTIAVAKAVEQAKKRMIKISLTKNGSFPYEVRIKFKSAYILLKPAPSGTGVKAGGPVRIVLDLAGVENVVAKMMGKSANKINYVMATYQALKELPKLKTEKKDNEKENKNSQKDTRNKTQDTEDTENNQKPISNNKK